MPQAMNPKLPNPPGGGACAGDAGQQCLARQTHTVVADCAAATPLIRQASGSLSSGELKLESPVQAAARKEAKQKRNANKWIFVTSADGQQLYVAPKVKGNFQHSSFLAGEQITGDDVLFSNH